MQDFLMALIIPSTLLYLAVVIFLYSVIIVGKEELEASYDDKAFLKAIPFMIPFWPLVIVLYFIITSKK